MSEVLNLIEARGETIGKVKILYSRLKMTPEAIAQDDDIQLSVEEVRAIIADLESK